MVERAELKQMLAEMAEQLDCIPDSDAETWGDVREAIIQASVAVRVLTALPDTETLASRLRAARLRRGISAAALARIAGLSKGYISEIETGKAPAPSADTLYRLAAVLDTTMEALLGRPRLTDCG